jgi:hypothetical protein
MVTVRFYFFTEEEEGRLYLEQIESRFLDEYPLSETSTKYDEEEEECSLNLSVDWKSIEGSDPDYILCEEICHEYEVYCSIFDESGKSNSYYYDEYDEWVIR